jgi:hypothetical protein
MTHSHSHSSPQDRTTAARKFTSISTPASYEGFFAPNLSINFFFGGTIPSPPPPPPEVEVEVGEGAALDAALLLILLIELL